MAILLSKERIVATADFNRWWVPVASVAIHLCIGSVYAWSIYNPALTRVFGVVTPAAQDWSLAQTNRVFTIAIVFLGLSAALAGKWLEDVGPRKVGTVAAQVLHEADGQQASATGRLVDPIERIRAG